MSPLPVVHAVTHAWNRLLSRATALRSDVAQLDLDLRRSDAFVQSSVFDAFSDDAQAKFKKGLTAHQSRRSAKVDSLRQVSQQLAICGLWSSFGKQTRQQRTSNAPGDVHMIDANTAKPGIEVLTDAVSQLQESLRNIEIHGSSDIPIPPPAPTPSSDAVPLTKDPRKSGRTEQSFMDVEMTDAIESQATDGHRSSIATFSVESAELEALRNRLDELDDQFASAANDVKQDEEDWVQTIGDMIDEKIQDIRDTTPQPDADPAAGTDALGDIETRVEDCRQAITENGSEITEIANEVGRLITDEQQLTSLNGELRTENEQLKRQLEEVRASNEISLERL